MTERLTTLAAVKDWLDISTDDSDTQLTRIIDAASQFILGYLNRDSLKVTEYTQNFKGNGKDTTLLRNWPVMSVSSVGIAGTLVSASTLGTAGLPSAGYRVSDLRQGPQSVDLYDYFYLQWAACQIIYEAGYETSQTTTLVAATAPTDPIIFTPTATGQWTDNVGVTLNGVAAVEVASAPAIGHYSVDEWGTYTFSYHDAAKVAIITYSYIPWDLSFACTELIGEWYRRKDRIGLLSKTLGGQETITFSSKDMNESIRGTFQNYRNVVPI